MRTPTSHAVAYEWHAEALADLRDGIAITVTSEVECGWFQRKLTRGGVSIDAKIWLDAEVDEDGELLTDEILRCQVGGDEKDPDEEWSYLAGHPITEAEFEYLAARRNYAAWHEPDSPFANPRRPVDWLTSPIPDFPARQEQGQ